MHTIYIDADACSVKDEIYRVAKRYRWPTIVVANQYMPTPSTPLISSVVVAQGSDVADDYIAERAGPGDIVVTADIPLAARGLENGARVLGSRGREFTEDAIGEALASRELSQQLREMGIMGTGPAPMAKKDRSRFLEKLDQLVHSVQRVHGPVAQ
jgi:uncharacterized protein YaiI (UPF0178 family)